MKKMFLIPIVMAAFVLSVNAQYDPDNYPSEEVTLGSAKISKGDLPSGVVKAVNTKFDKNNPSTWSKLPHTLKDYGWVYDFGGETKLSHYKVQMKTTSGDLLRGVYDTEGNLVESREISKNIRVPRYIMVALFEGPYKDWKIVGNREVVNFYNGKDNSLARQNFKLKLQKDKETAKLAFDYEASTGKLEARVIK